jgi:hypothetical protein
MSWSTPLTAVANASLTASQWNASVRDNLLMTAPALATTATGYFVATGTNAIAQRVPSSDAIATTQSTGSTSYADLTTAGPQVTITTGVAALVCFGSWMTNDTGGARALMSYTMSGATSAAAQDLTSSSVQITTSSSGCYIAATRTYMHTSLTSGSTTFKTQYKVSTGTGTYQQRTLSVLPL